MRVTLFDYGAGNLHSLAKALVLAGGDVRTEPDPLAALDTDVLVLPGVGAFGAAAARLAPARDELRAALAAGLPCLGICLGMQLLFERSEEGAGEGVGTFRGEVTRLRARRVPQIGWNAVEDARDELFTRSRLAVAYFANSFVCRPVGSADAIAWSTHEADRYPSAVRRGLTVGVQFHPEKSSEHGLAFLTAFLEQAAG